jgi:hypothetical protein
MKTIIYYTEEGHRNQYDPCQIVIEGDSIVDCKQKFMNSLDTRVWDRKIEYTKELKEDQS